METPQAGSRDLWRDSDENVNSGNSTPQARTRASGKKTPPRTASTFEDGISERPNGHPHLQPDVFELLSTYMDVAHHQQECFNDFLRTLGAWMAEIEAEREWVRNLRHAMTAAGVNVNGNEPCKPTGAIITYAHRLIVSGSADQQSPHAQPGEDDVVASPPHSDRSREKSVDPYEKCWPEDPGPQTLSPDFGAHRGKGHHSDGGSIQGLYGSDGIDHGVDRYNDRDDAEANCW